jgi:quercetin dioxygenase-like cupin family protein
MDFTVVDPQSVAEITRPHDPGEPARHVRELSDAAGFAAVRASLWRYDPGAKGRRHRHPIQEETFLVLEGTMSMYAGEPPERHDVPAGSLMRIAAMTPLQIANHGDGELVVYIHGYPPEDRHAEILDDAV